MKGSTFFPREYLFPRKKSTPGSTYFLGNKYWGVLISWEISTGEYLFTGVLFYGDTGLLLNFTVRLFCINSAWLKRYSIVLTT